MLKEDEYNYWRAPCESHQLQEMISRLAYKAMHEGLESATALEYIWYEWRFHEKLMR